MSLQKCLVFILEALQKDLVRCVHVGHPGVTALGRGLCDPSTQGSAVIAAVIVLRAFFRSWESDTTAPCMNYSCRTGSMIWTRSWKADRLLAECPGVTLRCLYPQLSVLFVLDTEFCNFKTGSKSEMGKKVLLSKIALAPPHPSRRLCCLQWTPEESSPLLLVFG